MSIWLVSIMKLRARKFMKGKQFIKDILYIYIYIYHFFYWRVKVLECKNGL